MIKIAVLGVCSGSTYFDIDIPGVELELFTQEKDMLNFNFDCPVIAHPPCAQWSRLRSLSRPDDLEKSLAFWCKIAVERCGGILEHPNGSLFMREFIGYDRCQSVDQHWFGFPARKSTLLYCHQVKLSSYPLCFDSPGSRPVQKMHSSERSRSPQAFNQWLVTSVADSIILRSGQTHKSS